MSCHVASLLLSLLVATALSAVALPPTQNTTTSPSLFVPYGGGGKPVPPVPPMYGCTKVGLFRSDKRPVWPDCHRAIRAMPSTHDKGTFHTSGYNDVWRLPRTEKFVKCRAQVETGNRMRTPSSWLAAVSALDHLNQLCRRVKSTHVDRSGGWMFLGPDRKIKVSLLGDADPESIGPPVTGTPGLFLTNETSNETSEDPDSIDPPITGNPGLFLTNETSNGTDVS